MMLVTSLNPFTHFFETENNFGLVQPVAWLYKAQEHCYFVGSAIYLKFSLFHLLCQFQNATSGTITTPTNNSLRSKKYTVWVALTFWKSTWCKFGDHFFPSFPHMRVSLVPEKQNSSWYCFLLYLLKGKCESKDFSKNPTLVGYSQLCFSLV